MGDLGVNRSRYSSKDQSTTALTRVIDKAPSVIQQTAGFLMAADQKLDKLPIVPFETPKKPSSSERIASGFMTLVYGTASGVATLIPFVGAWGASAIVAVGGFAARQSPNPEVQNQGNLALQTSTYGAITGCFGFGGVPYARAAVKSALIALNRT